MGRSMHVGTVGGSTCAHVRQNNTKHSGQAEQRTQKRKMHGCTWHAADECVPVRHICVLCSLACVNAYTMLHGILTDERCLSKHV